MEPGSPLPYSQAPANSIQSPQPLPTSSRYILILSSHYVLVSPMVSFPQIYPPKPCAQVFLRAKHLVLHSSHFCSQLTLLHGCALGERSSGGIWKFRTSSFKCYVDHSRTMYSSGNIDVRNWVRLCESRCVLIVIPVVCSSEKSTSRHKYVCSATWQIRVVLHFTPRRYW